MKKFKLIYALILISIFIVSSFCFGYGSLAYDKKDVNVFNSSIVLITGFEPFGNYDINPSQLIAKALNGQFIYETEIVGIVLPVDFEKSITNMTNAINQYNPSFIISLGLDGKTETIDVERLTINVKRYAKDENIIWFIPRIIEPGDPFFRFSTVKNKEIVENLREADIPTKSSFFAGTYVCNFVFYKTLGYINENNLQTEYGFLHIPLLDTQDPKGMSLETMINATRIAIQTNLE